MRKTKTQTVMIMSDLKPLPKGSVRLMLLNEMVSDVNDQDKQHLIPHVIHPTCVKMGCEMIGYRVPEDFKYGV